MGRRNGVRGTFSLATGKFGARREGGKEAEEGKKPGTGRDGHPGGNRSSSPLSRAGARGECRGPGPGGWGLGRPWGLDSLCVLHRGALAAAAPGPRVSATSRGQESALLASSCPHSPVALTLTRFPLFVMFPDTRNLSHADTGSSEKLVLQPSVSLLRLR